MSDVLAMLYSRAWVEAPDIALLPVNSYILFDAVSKSEYVDRYPAKIAFHAALLQSSTLDRKHRSTSSWQSYLRSIVLTFVIDLADVGITAQHCHARSATASDAVLVTRARKTEPED